MPRSPTRSSGGGLTGHYLPSDPSSCLCNFRFRSSSQTIVYMSICLGGLMLLTWL